MKLKLKRTPALIRVLENTDLEFTETDIEVIVYTKSPAETLDTLRQMVDIDVLVDTK